MKKHIVIACSIAALTSGAVTAQQSSPASTSPDAMSVTVTGCLKSWDGKSAGAAAGASAAGTQFVLTNVEHGASGDARATPPSADKAASDRGRAGGQVYMLSAGDSGVNLSQHLNHKVTVTGTKMAGHKGHGTSGMSATADRPGASSAPATAPGQDRADKATPAASMPALSVTSLTMVSSSCS